MRSATVKPQIAPSLFPAIQLPEPETPHQSNMSKRRTDTAKAARKPSTTSDDFGDDDLDDDTLTKAALGDLDFDHIENYANPIDDMTRNNTSKNKVTKDKSTVKNKNVVRLMDTTTDDDGQEPVQLANGKWACNHSCKDRNACKHLCCKDGMDKPPKKKGTVKQVSLGEERSQQQQKASNQKDKETQARVQLAVSKRKSSAPIEELDLTQQEKKRADYGTNGPRDYRDLHQLHKTVQGKELPSSLYSVMHKKPEYSYSQGGEHSLSFMDPPAVKRPRTSSDYGDAPFNELASYYDASAPAHVYQDLVQLSDEPDPKDNIDCPVTGPVASRGSDTFGDDDSMLGDAMIGLADSQYLQGASEDSHDVMQPLEQALDYQYQMGYGADPYQMDVDFAEYDSETYDTFGEARTPVVRAPSPKQPPKMSKPLFFNNTSSPQPKRGGFKPAKMMLKGSELREFKQPKVASPIQCPNANKQPMHVEDDIEDILDMFDDELFNEVPVKEKPVSEAFKDLEPWLFEEFGDIVELVDE
jgi:ATP-dependent DNA helicase HFM1/MER3